MDFFAFAASNARQEFNMPKQTTYFKGDKAEYTGKVLTLHGGTFYEVVMLEGHTKGQMKVVKDGPKETR